MAFVKMLLSGLLHEKEFYTGLTISVKSRQSPKYIGRHKFDSRQIQQHVLQIQIFEAEQQQSPQFLTQLGTPSRRKKSYLQLKTQRCHHTRTQTTRRQQNANTAQLGLFGAPSQPGHGH